MSVGLSLFSAGILALCCGVSAIQTPRSELNNRTFVDYQNNENPLLCLNNNGMRSAYNANDVEGMYIEYAGYVVEQNGISRTFSIRNIYGVGGNSCWWYCLNQNTAGDTYRDFGVSNYNYWYDYISDSFICGYNTVGNGSSYLVDEAGTRIDFLRSFYYCDKCIFDEFTFTNTQYENDYSNTIRPFIMGADFVRCNIFFKESFYGNGVYSGYYSFVQGNITKSFSTNYSITYSLLSDTTFGGMWSGVINGPDQYDSSRQYALCNSGSTIFYTDQYSGEMLLNYSTYGFNDDSDMGFWISNSNAKNVEILSDNNDFFKNRYSQVNSGFDYSIYNMVLYGGIPFTNYGTLGTSMISYTIDNFNSNSFYSISYAFLTNDLSNNPITIDLCKYDMFTIYNPLGDSYDNGFYNGYNNGYGVGEQAGYTTGYDDGYTIGYRAGKADATSVDTTFMGLFGTIADTPVLMLRSLFDFELFGMNMLSAVLSLLTGIIVIWVVRKII